MSHIYFWIFTLLFFGSCSSYNTRFPASEESFDHLRCNDQSQMSPKDRQICHPYKEYKYDKDEPYDRIW